MYCFKCNTNVQGTIRKVQETYQVKGEDITITATVRFCEQCGSDIWDEDLDEQNILTAYSEYRKKHDLLQPEDIRQIREKYGVSQKAFARILGLGDKTIARYETGSLADLAQNNLIELAAEANNFESLLEKNREKISDQDYQKAVQSLAQIRRKIIYSNRALTYTFAADSKLQYNFIPNESLEDKKDA